MKAIKSTFLFIAGFWFSFSIFATPPTSLSALQNQFGGQIGLYALDTANQYQIDYHAHERFPVYCTAKMMGVAAVLYKSEANPALLNKNIHYSKKELIEWSPITKMYVAHGMSVLHLCQAAITLSDNTAMNVLLRTLNGTNGINVFARSIGDKSFYLKDKWPIEADWQWGEKRDTDTPFAMAHNLQKLILGHALEAKQRQLLKTWLEGNMVGYQRIRAGVPQNWIVADKTGTGFYDAGMGDVAIIWPPKCKPIVLAVYYKKDEKNAPKKQAVISMATKIAINEVAKKDGCVADVLEAV